MPKRSMLAPFAQRGQNPRECCGGKVSLPRRRAAHLLLLSAAAKRVHKCLLLAHSGLRAPPARGLRLLLAAEEALARRQVDLGSLVGSAAGDVVYPFPAARRYVTLDETAAAAVGAAAAATAAAASASIGTATTSLCCRCCWRRCWRHQSSRSRPSRRRSFASIDAPLLRHLKGASPYAPAGRARLLLQRHIRLAVLPARRSGGSIE